MNKIKTKFFIPLILLSVGFLGYNYYINNILWNEKEIVESYWSIEMIWCEPEWGLQKKFINIGIDRFISNNDGIKITDKDNLYGKNIVSKLGVVDNVDYIARVLYCEALSQKITTFSNLLNYAHLLSIENAYSQQSTIKLINSLIKPNTFSLPFLAPSLISGNPAYDMTKERLFIHCCFIASVLESKQILSTSSINNQIYY